MTTYSISHRTYTRGTTESWVNQHCARRKIAANTRGGNRWRYNKHLRFIKDWVEIILHHFALALRAFGALGQDVDLEIGVSRVVAVALYRQQIPAIRWQMMMPMAAEVTVT